MSEVQDSEKKKQTVEGEGAEETSKVGIRINARSVGKQKEVSTFSEAGVSYEDELIEELGKKYHVPYKIVKEAVISVRRDDLGDQGRAAMLQYKLMTDDAIIKASVNYITGRITIIYNPKGAKNLRPKIDLEEVLNKLRSEGIEPLSVEERDYDYYREFYSYAFNPPKIRDRPPYGYDAEKWNKIKEEYEERRLKHEEEKRRKFREWQREYYEKHKDVLDRYPSDLIEGNT
ncbi:MAG: hypothetical protein ACP5GO_05670 [Thermoprotei archaeon]